MPPPDEPSGDPSAEPRKRGFFALLSMLGLTVFDLMWAVLVVIMGVALVVGIIVMVAHPFGLHPRVAYDKDSHVCDEGCD